MPPPAASRAWPLGTLKPSVSSEKITPAAGIANDSIDALPPRERGGILFRRYFPFDAEYSFLLRVRGNPAPGLPPAKLDLRIDGHRVKFLTPRSTPRKPIRARATSNCG